MADRIVEKVDSLIRDTIERLGYEIVDIEYKKQYGQMNLTVFIDIEKGVSLDDCETVHNAVNPILDEVTHFTAAPTLRYMLRPKKDPTGGTTVSIRLTVPKFGAVRFPKITAMSFPSSKRKPR